MNIKLHDENLVEEYMIGNTKIQIYNDAYVNKTKEDVNEIITNVNKIAIEILGDKIFNK